MQVQCLRVGVASEKTTQSETLWQRRLQEPAVEQRRGRLGFYSQARFSGIRRRTPQRSIGRLDRSPISRNHGHSFVRVNTLL